ncbi:lysophospholipid acyltransferase family protein [Campylobacter sp. 9BO]|uniref:lysophospholipid acyltransferase family protein n=1 Tax=Campylobacter sp. 9BO TaxID=3424759 RepID=UPI003D33FE0E
MILSRIKAFYYAIEFVISVVIVVFLMWLFSSKIHAVRRFWAKTQRWLGFYSIEVVGELKPDTQMIMINHKSMLDIVVLEEIYPKNLCWVAKKEIGDIPIIGKILSVPKMLPVDRSNPRAIVNLLKEAKDRIKKDRVIAIFPEGTRAKGDKLLKFQSGAKVIADKLDLRVQPVVIVGSDIMDAKKFSFKNGKIKVIYLDQIDRSDESWLENTRSKMQAVLDIERQKTDIS